MASAIAAILTASVLAFVLPSQAFAQPSVMVGGGSLSVAGSGGSLSVTGIGGAAPSIAANAPGLALSAAPGAATCVCWLADWHTTRRCGNSSPLKNSSPFF